ncbi:MAG: hypothetical protein J0M02_06895 [Planctomycetes bacterium]|nr:hypothetical protein [Planctomycetota bacterium]
MRRRAEIAKHTVEGALHALEAARAAAHEALEMAMALTIDPADLQAIRAATSEHVRRMDAALQAVQAAVRSAVEAEAVVDRAEITRFGIPVLRATSHPGQ